MKKKKELEKIKRALIIIDALQGFMQEGALSDPTIGHIVPNIVALIKLFQKEDDVIIFIKDMHALGCREFGLYPEHCLQGTSESELVSELQPYEQNALVYEKNSTNMMYAPNFISDMDQMEQLEEVVGVGCLSEVCVAKGMIGLNDFFNQIDRYVNLIVPEDAIETFDAPGHPRDEYNQLAYRAMKSEGIQLVKSYKGGK